MNIWRKNKLKSPARKEMMGLLGCFVEIEKEFMLELGGVSLTKSDC